MRLRPKTTLLPSDVPRAEQERAVALFEAACAEAGYPVTSYWDETVGAHRIDEIPLEVQWKAQQLVYDAVGWPYEMIPVDDEVTA